MRIRQVRPEFFSDATVSKLTPVVRLTYVGLWCVADDAGFMAWDVDQIAAQLYPYESIRVRTRRITTAGEALVSAGRLIVLDCGCAVIPKLESHQRIGGNKNYTAKEKHEVHTDMDKSIPQTPVGKGRLSNGSRARAPEGAAAPDEELLDAYRRQGLPVDAMTH